MSKSFTPPNFEEFSRWLAHRDAPFGTTQSSIRYQRLLTAARAARDETLRARAETLALQSEVTAAPAGRLERIEALAASDPSDPNMPMELLTARGFRVMLSYEEDPLPGTATLCVLVQAPQRLIGRVTGARVYLWDGRERHEIGELDVDGKAIGVLPVGLHITSAALLDGRVLLEEPDVPDAE